jgi:hypothetical protein
MRASTTPKLASNIMYTLAAVSASNHVALYALYVTFRTDTTGSFGLGDSLGPTHYKPPWFDICCCEHADHIDRSCWHPERVSSPSSWWRVDGFVSSTLWIPTTTDSTLSVVEGINRFCWNASRLAVLSVQTSIKWLCFLAWPTWIQLATSGHIPHNFLIQYLFYSTVVQELWSAPCRCREHHGPKLKSAKQNNGYSLIMVCENNAPRFYIRLDTWMTNINDPLTYNMDRGSSAWPLFNANNCDSFAKMLQFHRNRSASNYIRDK